MVDEQLITREELRKRCNVSDSTIVRWQRKGMPYYGGGGETLPRYDYDAVLAWLKEQSKNVGKLEEVDDNA
jgi:phage terminase Nu1 subunit (DNA packaging protein)